MILPRLRLDLDIMVSPIKDRPGILMRDTFKFSDATLIIPPSLIQSVSCFDGSRTDADLKEELARSVAKEEINVVADQLIAALGNAGFLEDETFWNLKQKRLSAFAASPVREAAFAGSAYPAELEPLKSVMQRYLGPAASTKRGTIGIAAPHVSLEGGWECYRAAYRVLPPGLEDSTFVVLGTSHYGQPDKFGLTRKCFETPFGTTRIDEALVDELALQPAVLMEDYCHAVEHSIEFQVLFLQSILSPEVRILPILCGSFGRHFDNRGLPEDDEGVKRFIARMGEIAEREKHRLFWVLGVDMAHMGMRYGDRFSARAEQDEMTFVRQRDMGRIDQMNAADAQGFWELVRENGDDLKWCGSSPIYTFMKAVPRARGALHRYEQWNIDEQSVVSFAGMSFSVV
jgi:AmmeMemoRadiSam system protein B